jgi:hypothetical protein
MSSNRRGIEGGNRRDRDRDTEKPSGRRRREDRERVDFDEKENMEITTDAEVEVYPTFDSMGLKEDLLRGIYSYGKYYFIYISCQ